MKKKVISVVGARPNFMKVAPIHKAFQKYEDSIEHLIVHTGQHYDKKMSDAFFKDLDMPRPAYFLGVGSGSHAEQTAKVMVAFEKICLEVKPDLVIVVGDVNSTIACGITAVKLGIKLAHVEAGLRSFDRSMPEEINRIVTDSICDFCFVTEQAGVDNLRKAGFPEDRIFLTGNTMIDSQVNALPRAEESSVLHDLKLGYKNYVVATIHRPSNVDDPKSLAGLLDAMIEISNRCKVVLPIHPRTRKNLANFGLEAKVRSADRLKLIDPLGYIDFLALTMNSCLVITDSGGIQEETTALGVPCLTIRTSTERPVTCEIGTNRLINPDPKSIRQSFHDFWENGNISGQVPPLWDGKAAERIVDIILNQCI